MRLLSRIRTLFSPAPVPAAVPAEPASDVELSADGFGCGARVVHWSDVVRIRTYKIDFVDIDCVCVQFELRGGPAVEVTEESNGFNDFVDELAERFPSIDPGWYATVMSPAFARNEAVLFEKASG